MSIVFEGIICFARDKDVQNVFVPSLSSIRLNTKGVDDLLTILYRPERAQPFSEEIEDIAAQLSLSLGPTIVARFDSIIGYRSSMVFENGVLVQIFAQDDEIYAPLDEEGEPMVNGPRVRLAELKPSEEYDTLQNAIQLGLEFVGQDVWENLFDFITHPSDWREGSINSATEL